VLVFSIRPELPLPLLFYSFRFSVFLIIAGIFQTAVFRKPLRFRFFFPYLSDHTKVSPQQPTPTLFSFFFVEGFGSYGGLVSGNTPSIFFLLHLDCLGGVVMIRLPSLSVLPPSAHQNGLLVMIPCFSFCPFLPPIASSPLFGRFLPFFLFPSPGREF